MRIEESQEIQGGLGAARFIVSRVRELAEGEDVPVGATAVPDDTPLSDWREKEQN